MTRLQTIQEMIALLLRVTMLPVIIREVFQKNKVTIIVYHRIPANLFENHVRYLTKRYSVIPLDELIKAKYKGSTATLPVKSLVITFDDGARINYTLQNIIKKYQIPVTMFVCSDILGTNRHFWFSYRNKIKTNLKLIPDIERIKLLSQVGFDEKRDYEEPQTLSMQETYDLLTSGVSIQSHTLSHPILPMCDDTKAETEINKSRTDLENNFGIRVNCIAYPNGNYLPRDIDLCKKSGYLAAVTMDSGFNDRDTDIYKLKRISIPDNANINQLAVRSSGVWDFFKGILKTRVAKKEIPHSLLIKAGGGVS